MITKLDNLISTIRKIKYPAALLRANNVVDTSKALRAFGKDPTDDNLFRLTQWLTASTSTHDLIKHILRVAQNPSPTSVSEHPIESTSSHYHAGPSTK